MRTDAAQQYHAFHTRCFQCVDVAVADRFLMLENARSGEVVRHHEVNGVSACKCVCQEVVVGDRANGGLCAQFFNSCLFRLIARDNCYAVSCLCELCCKGLADVAQRSCDDVMHTCLV